MGFELTVVRNNPLTGEEDLEQALRSFLSQIGYLPPGYQDEVGFRLMKDCFLGYPEKPWTVDELLTYLEANRSTLYRYLNKLKGLDILDEVVIPFEGTKDVTSRKTRKGYRLRYDSISYAWNMVESHVQVAMQNYRRSVDHIDSLARKRIEAPGEGERRITKVAVDGIVIRDEKKGKEVLLVRRGREPYKGMWALPGGFIEYGERAEDAVSREVQEETGLSCHEPILIGTRSRPGRDPRGHVVSLIFSLCYEGDQDPSGGDDAAEAKWFPVIDLPELAFDHREVLTDHLNPT